MSENSLFMIGFVWLHRVFCKPTMDMKERYVLSESLQVASEVKINCELLHISNSRSGDQIGLCEAERFARKAIIFKYIVKPSNWEVKKTRCWPEPLINGSAGHCIERKFATPDLFGLPLVQCIFFHPFYFQTICVFES